MKKKNVGKNGKNGQVPQEILENIVKMAIENRNLKMITDVIRNKQISKPIRQMIAKVYITTAKSILRQVYYKSTIRSIAKWVRALELTLVAEGFQEMSKWVRREFDKFLREDLWKEIKNKGKSNQEKSEKSDIDILRSYLGGN